MALKSLDHAELRIWSCLRAKQSSWVVTMLKDGKDDVSCVWKNFAANKIRREILGRFTAREDRSHVRMLAMARSLQHSRFCFDLGDTAAFLHKTWAFSKQKTSRSMSPGWRLSRLKCNTKPTRTRSGTLPCATVLRFFCKLPPTPSPPCT